MPGGAGTDYRSIVYKTFSLVQWVGQHSRPKFVLKTDDDAYVHTGNLVAALRKVRRLQLSDTQFLVPQCLTHCVGAAVPAAGGRQVPARRWHLEKVPL